MKITKEQFDNLPYDLKKNFIHRKIKRRPLDNIVETGAGALNIDGGRIPTTSPVTINRFTNGAKPWGDAKGEEFDTMSTLEGRWPANFILDESVAGRLDEQSGDRPTGEVHRRVGMGYHGSDVVQENIITNGGDSGGASRFFYNVQEQINEADPIYYCGKVGKVERNAGLDDEPEKELGHSKYDKCSNCGGYIFQSDGRNSKCLCENPIRVSNTQKNNHPTMKPIALAKYLATLLLPPDGYAPRRILVPFSGVGSEMIGAMQAGWEQIVGIEFDTENGYVNMAHKRIEYWSNK